MKRIHHPKPPVFIVVGLIISFAVSVEMYLWWRASETWGALLLAFFFFLIFIGFANPLIEWRTIVVEDGFLTVFKRFYRPIKVNISDSIFHIKMQNNKVHSFFFFRVDGRYIQIAPANYTKGSELSERIMAYVKKQNAARNVISD